jgi:mono/diheme cytochrome c family protein
MHKFLPAIALALTASTMLASCSSSGAGNAARGKQLFAQNCAVCHGPEGVGAEAPRLKGEATRKNTAQLIAWIKKPLPPMPTLYPSPLNERDVDDIAAYVEQLK